MFFPLRELDADLTGSGELNPEALPSWMNEPSEVLCLAVSARRA